MSNGKRINELSIPTLIVDDEPPSRDRLRSLLSEDPDIELVGECDHGTAAILAIRERKPALVFLDVEMPMGDGFEVLRALDSLPAVVFVTAHANYAVSAFEACALDYLLKPFLRSRFYSVLLRAKNHIRRSEAYARQRAFAGQPVAAGTPQNLLIVKAGGRLVFLRLSELRWVQAEKDYVRLHLRKGSHFVRETLTSIHERLDPSQFLRIHRSAVINISEICELRPDTGGDCTVLLRDGTELAVSRRYRPALDCLLVSSVAGDRRHHLGSQ